MHDATVDRVADETSPVRSGALADLPWTTLRRVVLRGGHAIPRLEDVLDTVTVPIMLEIKAPAATDLVVAALRGREIDWELSRVSSFRAEAVARVKELAPHLPVAPISDTVDDDYWALLDELDAASVSTVHWSSVPAAVVDRAHASGRTVITGGLGEAAMAAAQAAGVDGFCTDDPRIVAGRR
ncbi:glycerophosphodiester phosphodiesterase [Propionibacteriaceae bacterium Y1685]